MTTSISPRAVPTAKVTDGHPLVRALLTLTLVSGLIDAVSYLGLGHVFTANMTGNVVVVAFALAGAPGFSLVGSLISLAAFLLGSVCAGRLAASHQADNRVPWIRTALAAEAVLQAVATVMAFVFGDSAQFGLIAVLAVAMGLRNGTVRKLGVPDMTTTVLTLTLTGLGSDSSLGHGDNPRMRRRLLAVAAMLVGAAPGAVLVLHDMTAWALLASTVLVALTLVTYRERG